MTRNKKRVTKALPTIWTIPDELWEKILPILEAFWPSKRTGRHVANWRRMLEGIIFRMRSGCQWEQLPGKYGPKSTVHDWFQRWSSGGVMKQIWEVLVAECNELGAVEWDWQAADGCMGKARFGGKRWAKTPRIAAKTARRSRCWLMAMAGPWAW